LPSRKLSPIPKSSSRRAFRNVSIFISITSFLLCHEGFIPQQDWNKPARKGRKTARAGDYERDLEAAPGASGVRRFKRLSAERARRAKVP
jgi:hypothetical protein